MDDERERAWATVHDAIANVLGWAVGPASYHGEDERWHVTAVDLQPRGRLARREAIEVTGPTEVAALDALATLLAARVSGR